MSTDDDTGRPMALPGDRVHGILLLCTIVTLQIGFDLLLHAGAVLQFDGWIPAYLPAYGTVLYEAVWASYWAIGLAFMLSVLGLVYRFTER